MLVENDTDDAQSIRREALAAMEKIAAKQGPYSAELHDGEMQWYALLAAASHERILAAHLQARRLGGYVPMFEHPTRQQPGRTPAQRRLRLLLPGYVFLCERDLAAQMRIIRACPGFRSLLLDSHGHAHVIPHDTIAQFMRLEFSEGGWFGKPTKRKRRNTATDDGFRVTVRAYDALHGIERIARAKERLSLFHKAMGITPS